MSNNKISIIVPVYNLEKYIERTASSILEQTYSNIEVVLVDDGSTDNSPSIIDNIVLLNDRVKVLHKENGGVTAARLSGVEIATGDWIGFVDGDDLIEPDMYETLIKNAVEYDADISHCGYQMVFPSRVDYYYNTGRLVQQDKLTGIKDLLAGSFIEPGLWNKLFHKTLFHSLLHDELMDLSIKNNEDLLMNYYLFREAKKSVFYDKCYYHYILRKGSASKKELNEHILMDPLRVQKKLLNETANTPELSQIVKSRIIDRLINISTISYGKQKELIKPFRRQSRKELRRKIGEVIRENYSIKHKISVVWVSIWPASYRWIHNIYAKITGIDKKYEVK